MKQQLYLLFLLLLFTFAMTAQDAAAAVDMQRARFWEAPDKARLVFDVADAVRFSVQESDDQVILTVKEAVFAADLPLIGAGNKYVRALRRLPGPGDVVTIAIDTLMPLESSAFLLRPTGPYGHRLVLDLKPRETAPSAAPAGTTEGEVPAGSEKTGLDTSSDQKARETAIKALLGDLEQDKPAPSYSTINAGRPWLIAIDAGHGGEDPGAIGHNGAHEKNVTLAIARALARRIAQTPGMRPFLTRDGDYFVTLWDRTKKARRAGADLFISIHADAAVNASARGASVYTLSRKGASDQAAAMLANKENQADLVGGVKIADKDNVLASVLLDLSQTATINDSQGLATSVLGQLGQISHLHRSRFGEAGFVVLKSPDVPSVLVETGFITNPDEEQMLTNPAYQEQIAEAIFLGIGQYMARHGRALPLPAASRLAKAEGPRLQAAGPSERDVRTHRVRVGETLSSIARLYSVSIAKLQEVNALRTDQVMAGQKLLVP